MTNPTKLTEPLVLVSIDQEDLQAVLEDDDGATITDSEADAFLRYLHGRNWGSMQSTDYLWDTIESYYEDFKQVQKKAEATE